MRPLQIVTCGFALAAMTLLIAGCASGPASPKPTSSAAPDGSGASSAPVVEDDIEAAWLDDGRMVGIVTLGSSTCIPIVDEITGVGQTVRVSLVDAPAVEGSEPICTADLAPRATLAALPEGVDPTKDVELVVTLGDITDDVDLDGNPGLTGVPGETTTFEPSAGWFDDEGVVLLTWGSSTCPPIVEDADQQATGATISFATQDGACTMDMAPRATVIGLSGDIDDDVPFALTLTGGGLDATVDVLAG